MSRPASAFPIFACVQWFPVGDTTTLEYINPTKFGQVDTLAGMVSLAPKDRDLPILKKAHKEFGSTVVDIAGGPVNCL